MRAVRFWEIEEQEDFNVVTDMYKSGQIQSRALEIIFSEEALLTTLESFRLRKRVRLTLPHLLYLVYTLCIEYTFGRDTELVSEFFDYLDYLLRTNRKLFHAMRPSVIKRADLMTEILCDYYVRKNFEPDKLKEILTGYERFGLETGCAPDIFVRLINEGLITVEDTSDYLEVCVKNIKSVLEGAILTSEQLMYPLSELRNYSDDGDLAFEIISEIMLRYVSTGVVDHVFIKEIDLIHPFPARVAVLSSYSDLSLLNFKSSDCITVTHILIYACKRSTDRLEEVIERFKSYSRTFEELMVILEDSYEERKIRPFIDTTCLYKTVYALVRLFDIDIENYIKEEGVGMELIKIAYTSDI